MECEPTASVLVVNVAFPVASNVPVPSVVEPSTNVTVPPGIPPEEVTVAVMVMDWPKVEGEGEIETAVPVVACETVWAKVVELLAAKLVLAA